MRHFYLTSILPFRFAASTFLASSAAASAAAFAAAASSASLFVSSTTCDGNLASLVLLASKHPHKIIAHCTRLSPNSLSAHLRIHRRSLALGCATFGCRTDF